MRHSVRAQMGCAGALALIALGGTSAGATTTASDGITKTGITKTGITKTDVAGTGTTKPGIAEQVRADLNEYLRTQGVADHSTAVSVRITYPGGKKTLAVTAGDATDRSSWQIGSNTKAMTSVVVLKLEAGGRLSIDDRLGKWLPQYPQWKAVTVRQLLSMTSGIPDYVNTQAFVDAIAADPSQDVTAEEMISWVGGEPLDTTAYSYSNTNYLLAQLVIEAVTNESYFDEVTTSVLKPLKLNDTCFAPETCSPGVTRKMPDGFSMQTGLDSLKGQAVPKLALSWGQGTGGLVSTLADMTTWQRALYSGAELPAKQQRELKSLLSITTSEPISTVTSTDPAGFGLGVAQRYSPVSGVTWAYEGATLGYRVFHQYVPKTGMLMAVAVNSSVDTSTLPELADTVYQTVTG